MVRVRIDIAEQSGSMVDAVDDDIDLSVVEDITETGAAPREYICQPGTDYRRHKLKFLSLIDVVEQQRPLRERCAKIVFVNFREDMAVDKENVLPAIIVVIDKFGRPREKRIGDRGNAIQAGAGLKKSATRLQKF